MNYVVPAPCGRLLKTATHKGSRLQKLKQHCTTGVCPAGKFVAGSMGPTGDLIEPLGPRTVQEAYDIFAEQAVALAEGGVDIIFVETMVAAEEVEIAVRAVKEKTNLPVVATMTFELGKAGLRTIWGVDVPTAVRRLTAAGADVIGANCGRGFDDMIAIIQEMRPLTRQPIIAQPNAGIPVCVFTQTGRPPPNFLILSPSSNSRLPATKSSQLSLGIEKGAIPSFCNFVSNYLQSLIKMCVGIVRKLCLIFMKA